MYDRERDAFIVGPAPGVLNFIRWLFEPIRLAPPPELPSPEVLQHMRDSWRKEKRCRDEP